MRLLAAISLFPAPRLHVAYNLAAIVDRHVLHADALLAC
jgi:hypothetical protein